MEPLSAGGEDDVEDAADREGDGGTRYSRRRRRPGGRRRLDSPDLYEGLFGRPEEVEDREVEEDAARRCARKRRLRAHAEIEPQGADGSGPEEREATKGAAHVDDEERAAAVAAVHPPAQEPRLKDYDGEEEDLEDDGSETYSVDREKDASEDDNGEGSSSPLPHDAHKSRVAWMLLCMMMVAEVVGSGVLTLPRAFARLGWVPAMLILVLLYVITTHTGIVIHRLRYSCPQARSYPSYFRLSVNRGMYRYASVMVYLLLFMYTAAAVLIQVSTYRSMFPLLSHTQWTLVACALALLALQERTLRGIGVLCVVSVTTVLLAVVLSIVDMRRMVAAGGLPLGTTVLFGDSFQKGVVASMNVVFAFSGHIVFFELISQMRRPDHFPRALYLSQTFVLALYVGVGCSVYAMVGDAEWLVSPFTVSLRPGAMKTVVQLLVIVHSLVGLCVNGNVLIRAVQNAAEPRLKRAFRSSAADDVVVAAREVHTCAAISWWGVWSLLTMSLIAAVIVVVPSFEHFIALIASLAASQTTLGWPGFLDLYMYGRRRHDVRGFVRNLGSGSDVIFAAFSLVAGLAANVLDMRQTPSLDIPVVSPTPLPDRLAVG